MSEHGAKHIARFEKRAAALVARMKASPLQADFADEEAELQSVIWVLAELLRAPRPPALSEERLPLTGQTATDCQLLAELSNWCRGRENAMDGLKRGYIADRLDVIRAALSEAKGEE